MSDRRQSHACAAAMPGLGSRRSASSTASRRWARWTVLPGAPRASDEDVCGTTQTPVRQDSALAADNFAAHAYRDRVPGQLVEAGSASPSGAWPAATTIRSCVSLADAPVRCSTATAPPALTPEPARRTSASCQATVSDIRTITSSRKPTPRRTASSSVRRRRRSDAEEQRSSGGVPSQIAPRTVTQPA
jgi:hypothetical protein